MVIKSKWFYGHEVSPYGQENGYVDYRTLAQAFDAVMCNDIMQQTDSVGLGFWEQISGFVDNSEEIEELEAQIEEIETHIDGLEHDIEQNNMYETDLRIEELSKKQQEIQDKIDELEYEQENPDEVFQWFIVDTQGSEILQEAGEIVYYNEVLDLYLWGVTHWGTSWDYVLTDIKIVPDKV